MVATKKTALTPPTTPQNFEAAYAELEQIVAEMAAQNVSLQDSLAAYTRGHFLLQFCQQSLADVEQQVQLLNAQNTLVAFNLQQD